MGRDKYPVAHKDNPSVFSDSAVAESKDLARDNRREEPQRAHRPKDRAARDLSTNSRVNAAHARSNQRSELLPSHKEVAAKATSRSTHSVDSNRSDATASSSKSTKTFISST